MEISARVVVARIRSQFDLGSNNRSSNTRKFIVKYFNPRSQGIGSIDCGIKSGCNKIRIKNSIGNWSGIVNGQNKSVTISNGV